MDAVSFCGVYGYERYVDDYAGRVDSYVFPNQPNGRKCVQSNFRKASAVSEGTRTRCEAADMVVLNLGLPARFRIVRNNSPTNSDAVNNGDDRV